MLTAVLIAAAIMVPSQFYFSGLSIASVANRFIGGVRF